MINRDSRGLMALFGITRNEVELEAFYKAEFQKTTKTQDVMDALYGVIEDVDTKVMSKTSPIPICEVTLQVLETFQEVEHVSQPPKAVVKNDGDKSLNAVGSTIAFLLRRTSYGSEQTDGIIPI